MPVSRNRKGRRQVPERVARQIRAANDYIGVLAGALVDARNHLMVASATLRVLGSTEVANLLATKALAIAAVVPPDTSAIPLPEPATLIQEEEPRIVTPDDRKVSLDLTGGAWR